MSAQASQGAQCVCRIARRNADGTGAGSGCLLRGCVLERNRAYLGIPGVMSFVPQRPPPFAAARIVFGGRIGTRYAASLPATWYGSPKPYACDGSCRNFVNRTVGTSGNGAHTDRHRVLGRQVLGRLRQVLSCRRQTAISGNPAVRFAARTSGAWPLLTLVSSPQRSFGNGRFHFALGIFQPWRSLPL